MRPSADRRDTSLSLKTLRVLVIVILLLIFVIHAISIAFRSFGFDVVLLPRSCSGLEAFMPIPQAPKQAGAFYRFLKCTPREIQRSVLLTVALHGCIPVDWGH